MLEEKQPIEEPKPQKATTTVAAIKEESGYCVCVSKSGEGFLVPSELCPDAMEESFELNIHAKGVEALYSWKEEIDKILPRREEIVLNIRRALWINGAYNREAAAQPKVQRNIMRGAFPYRINTEEKS